MRHVLFVFSLILFDDVCIDMVEKNGEKSPISTEESERAKVNSVLKSKRGKWYTSDSNGDVDYRIFFLSQEHEGERGSIFAVN